ncbi:MAG: hypothetical protein FJX67_18950, partial [Alphaproteobacteria bacterium]|nr:hypothetical protein [Alphaproteobacteria bacterium]
MLDRRALMRFLAAGGGALLLPAGARLAFAAALTERRFVAVVLRGGLDGLAAVPPHADRDYRDLRGALALPPPGAENGVLDLDGRFGLHPALGPLHALYRARRLLVVHAVATPYRSRSHFDGQDLLENGTALPHGAKDGGLNRALALMNQGDRRLGLAVGTGVPLILRGQVSVGAWAPQTLPEAHEDFLSPLELLYNDDPLLARALRDGMAAQKMAGEVPGEDARQGGGGGSGGSGGGAPARRQ